MEMTTIANFGSLQEAEMLKLKLEMGGIEAFIPDAISAGVGPHLFMGREGVRVQVSDKDKQAAIDLLKEMASETSSED